MARHRLRRWLQFGTLDLLILTAIVGVVGALYRPPRSDTFEVKLSTRLRRWFANETTGYHKALREATQEARRLALGRPWPEVEAQLRRDGFPIESRAHQYDTSHRVVVAQDIRLGSNPAAHALFLEFTVDQRTTQQVPNATPGFVYVAYAGLHVKVNRPHADVLASGRYPEGSVLDRGLRCPEALDAAKRDPILKEVEITYDVIRYHRWPSFPYGFGLWLTFGGSMSDERQGQTMYLTAVSGLDTGEDSQGNPVVRPNFAAEDTIDDFWKWGGSRWGPDD